MKVREIALTGLSTRDLENLLRAVHRGLLECPINPERLTRAGLSYLWDRTDFLHGHDKAAVQAILVATLAERRKAEPNTPPSEG